MACTEPDAPDPMAQWSPENTIITVIIDRITGESTALLAYTALVALVLTGLPWSADPIKPPRNLRKEGGFWHIRRDGEIWPRETCCHNPCPSKG